MNYVSGNGTKMMQKLRDVHEFVFLWFFCHFNKFNIVNIIVYTFYFFYGFHIICFLSLDLIKLKIKINLFIGQESDLYAECIEVAFQGTLFIFT